MSDCEHAPRLLRFGAFELDRTARELRKQGRLVPLTDQPFRVLDLLVANAGRVVTRDELQRAIWGDDTHVDFEAGLSTCVNQVRSALGDRAAFPRFVETLPKRGYRFVAPIEPIGEARPVGQDFPARRRARRRWPAAAFVAASVAVLAAAMNWPAPHAPSASSVNVRPTPAEVPATPVVVVPVRLSPRLSNLQPLATSLTEALIGALATEGGPRLQVASPVAVQHLRDARLTLDNIRDVGADFYVSVSLSSLGSRINVHAKVSTISGWMIWSTDRVFSARELGTEQLGLAADLSHHVVREIEASRTRPLASAQLHWLPASTGRTGGPR